MITPTTDAKWQEAVDVAYACLALDSAHKYGLVTGGPAVNLDHCEEILRHGAARGLTPLEDAIERFVKELTSQ